MKVEAEFIGELIPNLPEPSMRNIFYSLESKLSTGTTIRLLRCRNETRHKVEMSPGITVLDDSDVTITKTRNELVASFWDSKKAGYRDFVRMIVADTLPEAMPEFLKCSSDHLERLLPKYESLEKVQHSDCRTVGSFEEFAEALSRR